MSKIVYEVTVEDKHIEWYLNGKLHREDGPAVEHYNGSRFWYINNNLHREDGPAVEYADGQKVWWINGKIHREDGPAIEYADGAKTWCINGKEYTEVEYKKKIAAMKDPRKTCADKVVEIDGVKYKLVKQ